jgi:hypothetical protein
MRRSVAGRPRPNAWEPIPDPDLRFSSGVPDFDRLLGGGFSRGSFALMRLDETVTRDDLDLLLFPTFVNFLQQSRGVLAVLPARDSPRDFRSRLTRFVTRRRFDRRVRVVDYAGEDEGPPYVVNLRSLRWDATPGPKNRKTLRADFARMAAAERAILRGRKKAFLELNAFEVLDTLVGSDKALRMIFYGVKRARHVGNLVVGLLRPGLGCAPGVRSMADSEFVLKREEVSLTIRGVAPSFATHVVAPHPTLAPPHVVFVPEPGRLG